MIYLCTRFKTFYRIIVGWLLSDTVKNLWFRHCIWCDKRFKAIQNGIDRKSNFGDCCLECNALLNKDLEQLKEDLSYTDMDELSEEEKEIVKEF